MRRKYSLGLLTIATNGYVKYLQDLISSAEDKLENFEYFRFHVFTDDPGSVIELRKSFPSVEISIHEIESYGWPDATLKRYEIYSAHSTLFNEDILMHIDADMYFLDNLEFEVDPEDWKAGMAFVEHPGYWNPNLEIGIRTFVKMKIRKFIRGGYGSWESNPKSKAYTPRKKRKIYCCGGTWFGLNEKFLAFCNSLSVNVKEDSAAGVMAVWHDESHLNAFVSSSDKPTILSSRYCYEPKFGKLVKNPLILAIDKSISLDNQLMSVWRN